jgi:perosamine synthetase
MITKIKTSQPWIDFEEKKNVNAALKEKAISGFYGTFINKFEKKFSNYCGAKYGVSTNSGTTALHLAVKTLGIGPGDEVIVTTFTNMASIFSIIYTGACPIPVDIEEITFNINPNLIEKKINKNTKAIMVVHIFGHPVDFNKIKKIAKKYNLLIIEDCAEAHGAEYYGKKVGSLGDAGCFSFYANKIITTGEGGMVIFNNKKLAKKAKNLKELSFGKYEKFQHNDIGFNYRMTNLQAAIGCAQMGKINKIIKKKRLIAKYYKDYLGNFDQINLPKEEDYAKHVYWVYHITLKNINKNFRNKIMIELAKKGIETRETFVPFDLQKKFIKEKKFKYKSCAVADRVSNQGFYLPSGYELHKKDIKYISKILIDLLKKNESKT